MLLLLLLRLEVEGDGSWKFDSAGKRWCGAGAQNYCNDKKAREE
jgi:hypothetical protein